MEAPLFVNVMHLIGSEAAILLTQLNLTDMQTTTVS
jgi:hypothetical protein